MDLNIAIKKEGILVGVTGDFPVDKTVLDGKASVKVG